MLPVSTSAYPTMFSTNYIYRNGRETEKETAYITSCSFDVYECSQYYRPEHLSLSQPHDNESDSNPLGDIF
ncbi:hypothetical protein Ddc_12041 [Ditylenchus destructor]|nr:hypothetical protein Ddc_12041 [Ditylenchus destructor]